MITVEYSEFETDYKAALCDMVINGQLGHDTLDLLNELHTKNRHLSLTSDLEWSLINWCLNGHGLECVDDETDCIIEYINTGDLYHYTVCKLDDQWIAGSVADIIEKGAILYTQLTGCYMPDNSFTYFDNENAVYGFIEECVNQFSDMEDDKGNYMYTEYELRRGALQIVTNAITNNYDAVGMHKHGYSVYLSMNSLDWPSIQDVKLLCEVA